MLAFTAVLLQGAAASRLDAGELWTRESSGNVGYGFDPALLMHIDWNDRSSLAPSVKAVNITAIALIAVIVGLRIWVRIAIIHLIFTAFWTASAAFTKLSITCFCMRIFPHNTSLRRALYVIAAMVVAHSVATGLVLIFQCRPIHKAWELSLNSNPQSSGHCINLVVFGRATAAINILTDFAVCLAPTSSFWRIQISVCQRIGLIILFLLGLCSCVFSICRLVMLWQIERNLMDWAYDSGNIIDASVAELFTAIICVSIPALRPLVDKLSPSLFGRGSSRPGRVGSPPGAAGPAAANKRSSRPPASRHEDAIMPKKDEEGTELVGISRTRTDEEMAVVVGSRPASMPGSDPQPRAKRTTDGWYELDLE
ncbi:hypothetical protein RB594_006798 [Gaeumannomyces avenae]